MKISDRLSIFIHSRTLRFFSSVLLLGMLFSCAHRHATWVVAGSCANVPLDAVTRYTLIIKNEQSETLRLILVNRWESGQLSSVGINPMGVKIFSATWSKSAFLMDMNPLYKEMDVNLVLQGVLFSEWIIPELPQQPNATLDLCLADSSVDYSLQQDKIFLQLSKKHILTVSEYDNASAKLQFQSNNYVVNYRILH